MTGRETAAAGQKGCAFEPYAYSIGQTLYSFFEDRDVKVDEKPNFEAGQFEISEELGLMYGLKHLASFELDDQAISHDEVR